MRPAGQSRLYLTEVDVKHDTRPPMVNSISVERSESLSLKRKKYYAESVLSEKKRTVPYL